MAVHWRAGFRRLAAVTSWAYWALAVVFGWIVFRDAMEEIDITTYQTSWNNESLGHAFTELGGYLVAAIVSYGVLLLLFRALRWIARGFVDGDAA